MFLEGGYEALSITEVCRRAGVSAPSLYARVNGLDGLFRAVYERCMSSLDDTERRVFSDVNNSVEAVVSATSELFSDHARALRAIIRQATADDELLEEGAERSRQLRSRIAEMLPGDDRSVQLAARTIYTECAFSVIYGDNFWRPEGESVDQFRSQLSEKVHRILVRP